MSVFIVKYQNGMMIGNQGNEVSSRANAKEFISRENAEAYAARQNEGLEDDEEEYCASVEKVER